MIVGDGRLHDVYRRLVWGPGRHILSIVPAPWEALAVRAGGRTAAALMSAKRDQIRRNMARAFGPRDELDRWSSEAFAAHTSNVYVGMSFRKCRKDNWERYLRLDGLHHLEAARAKGRGVVVLHPHMGATQLPLHVLGLEGFPVHQIGGGRVVRSHRSAAARWAEASRAALERESPVTFHDGRNFLRPVVRALRAGAVVLTACDATGGGEELGRRVPATVLGQRMRVPIGGVKLALMTGASLVTLTCARRSGLDPLYQARIGPSLDLLEGSGDRHAVEAWAAETVAGFLTRTLTEHPGDWHFWDGFEPGALLEAGPG